MAINLYNAYGQTDFGSVEWLSADVTRAPRARECPLEKELCDWCDLDSFQAQSVERLQIPDFFGPHLEHVETDFAGLDIAVSRSVYSEIQITCCFLPKRPVASENP